MGGVELPFEFCRGPGGSRAFCFVETPGRRVRSRTRMGILWTEDLLEKALRRSNRNLFAKSTRTASCEGYTASPGKRVPNHFRNEDSD